jgi:outer membrane protein assembly factor BamA
VSAFGQTADQAAPAPPRFEINSVSFEGNQTLSGAELQAQLTTRSTPGLFGKLLSSISQNMGPPDEFLDLAALSGDLERLRTYYESRGFSETDIDTTLEYDHDDLEVDITIRIEEGYRSIVDSLQIRGLEEASPLILENLAAAPVLSQGDPYNVALLEEEVRRIVRILNDNGYARAAFVQDSSWARRYASTRNYDVLLVFVMRGPYAFGPVTVTQQIDFAKGEEPRPDITTDLVMDHLDYEPGELFSLQKKLNSESNLNRLGIFELRAIDLVIPRESDSSNVVPSLINIRPLDKHELAPDLFISDEDGAFNLGTGLGYTNRNFLGGGKRFSTRLRFRTQTLREFPDFFARNSDAIANLDLTFELSTPYVFSNRNTGSWSLSFVLDKQIPYLQNIVRSKLGLVMRSGRFTTNYLDWIIESVTLQVNDNFEPSDQDEETQRAIRLLQEQQQNSILSFTVSRDRSNDLFTPSAGFINTVTLEESGLLPSLLKNLIPNIRYTQFYRAVLMGRWYMDVSESRFSVLALKVRAGWEGKYGESHSDTSRVIPQTHRFFAGGGSSVRGWGSRDLIARGDPQLGGNLLYEASAELRTNIFQGLRNSILDKVWLVTFLDIGNLWRQVGDFQLKSIAAAFGLGFRYDTLFGPFRIDWGLRLYNPMAPEGQQWVSQKKLFGQTFKEGVFHFGIGHAF